MFWDNYECVDALLPFCGVITCYDKCTDTVCIIEKNFCPQKVAYLSKNSVVSEISLLLPNSLNGRILVPKCGL